MRSTLSHKKGHCLLKKEYIIGGEKSRWARKCWYYFYSDLHGRIVRKKGSLLSTSTSPKVSVCFHNIQKGALLKNKQKQVCAWVPQIKPVSSRANFSISITIKCSLYLLFTSKVLKDNEIKQVSILSASTPNRFENFIGYAGCNWHYESTSPPQSISRYVPSLLMRCCILPCTQFPQIRIFKWAAFVPVEPSCLHSETGSAYNIRKTFDKVYAAPQNALAKGMYCGTFLLSLKAERIIAKWEENCADGVL